MKNGLQKYKVNKDATVRQVIEHMDSELIKFVFVMNEKDELCGLFTHGDMRKYFLKNGNMTVSIEVAMNTNPIVFYSYEEAQAVAKEKELIVYPIVDKEGHIIDAIYDCDEKSNAMISDALNDVPLVIMAGGKGTRLYPYTKILPKALIPIGDITISERIIQKFMKYGCQQVYFIVKHKANMIKSYFNDLEKNYQVDYVEEKEFLGTGGGLGLLKGKINQTCIVSNCDILVNCDFECALKTHHMNHNVITMICAMKDVVIPYGVVETDNKGSVVKFNEKPEMSFLTNTGIYIVEPCVIQELKENEFIHMPDIAQRYMDAGKNVGVFPISEKAWFDMGQFGEMENMLKELGV